MKQPIEWEWYRAFLGVLTEGSLSGAARALGITQPTVGRHIAALEKALNLVLFTRSQAGLLPTDAARALQPHAEAMASTAAALERAASGEGVGDNGETKGVVRVTASEIIGVEVLPPIVAALREQHPALKIELMLSSRVHDLLQREADIAVRMTPPKQGQLIARHVGSVELGLHARADYLQRQGTPVRIEDLEHHTVIGFDQVTPFIRKALAALPDFSRDVFSIRTDSDLAQLAMIRTGAGIGFCQAPLARRAPALVRVLPQALSLRLDTWIAMHEDLRNSPRCRVVFDALAAGLQAYLA
ncbi:LysR family transcriptional regulator [Pseudoduganella ginsengisoli]|uniref:LysR family transcriptional regulator n=1 Tax=Pseudoduganella ginsengisoli TaxID=1462440 RepID=A0A6L6Q850_9BURK|nr:LysR family transcriptional regulator [Pseudoduganella ginsengisoli]MTW05644.1 LysR family transcriptional regulator [Pseudoduganella ginsengisoli]